MATADHKAAIAAEQPLILTAHPSGSPHQRASEIVQTYGVRARQAVVDLIVEAIRDCDMDAAHMWDRVGDIIDAGLDDGRAVGLEQQITI